MFTRWIDTHTHIFAERCEDETTAFNLAESRKLCDAKTYLDAFGEHAPAGVVVADFSKGRTSEHVICALDDFRRLGMPAKGIIKANPFDTRTTEWLTRPDIAGVRFYALTDVPDLSEHKAFWDKTFTDMRRRNQHILVFGGGDNLLKLIAQLPQDITLLIDHLGLPNAESGDCDHKCQLLLSRLKSRREQGGAPAYIKGPGYRTSMQVAKTQPFVNKIYDMLGAEALILGASDTPFLGPVMGYAPEYSGKSYPDFMTTQGSMNFIEALVEGLAQHSDTPRDEIARKVLHDNAEDVYNFSDMQNIYKRW